jgi:hypothetical protein
MGTQTKNKSVKDPEGEAETPSKMPEEEQGRGGKKSHNDLEGQQGGTNGGGHENS